jgi:hypothetical protein
MSNKGRTAILGVGISFCVAAEPTMIRYPRFDPGFSASDIRGSTPVLSKWGLGIY